MRFVTIALVLVLVPAVERAGDAAAPKKNDPLHPPMPELPPEIPAADPDNRPQILGKYLKPGAKDLSIVLASPVEKSQWQQLTPNQQVRAGQTFLALPGCKGDLQLDLIKLTMSGCLPETVPLPPIMESVIELHQHEKLDVDFTLRQGRVVLTAEGDKVLVRIRFENPAIAERGEIIDLVLQGKGTQVLLDRGGSSRPGRHFFKDSKDPMREAPEAFLGLWVLKGQVGFRHGKVSHTLAAPPGQAKQLWHSVFGLKQPEKIAEVPASVSLDPPLPEGLDKDQRKLRDQILQARDNLAREPAGKAIGVRLAEASKSADVGRRIMAGRCYAAMGAVPELLELLIDERDAAGWLIVMDSVRHWIALSRDNEYKVFDQASKRFTVEESAKIVELLNGLASPELLIAYLDNSHLLIRKLAHHNLCEVLPKGRSIRYDPAMPAQQRLAAQEAWRKLLQK